MAQRRLGLLVLMALFAGCGQPVHTVASKGVVAEVNGQPVYWEEVEFQVLLLQARSGVRYEGPTGERVVDDLRRQILRRMIDQVLVAGEATRRGYRADPAAVSEEEQKIKQSIPQGSELASRVARGEFQQAIRAMARRAAVGRRFLTDLRRGVVVTPAEVAQYYHDRRETEFFRPEGVVVKQILTKSRDRAARALARLQAGEPFDAVAQRYADDPRDAVRTLYLLLRGQTDRAREEAAFRLPVGAFSGILRSQGGYVILRVVARQPARRITLEQARPQIERLLRSRKEAEVLNKLLERLRKEAKIVEHWPSPSPKPPSASPPQKPGN